MPFTPITRSLRAVHLSACLAVLSGCASAPQSRADNTATPKPTVEVLRIPDGGYQVQAATDARGVTHIVYLKGEPGSADLFYSRFAGGWANPLRVGPLGSAVGAGTIRGPQLALGRGGRAHVVWFGSEKSGMKTPDGAPLLYSRLAEDGGSFEAPRNLMRVSKVLDGGPGVAADAQGNVYVAWQAAAAKGEGELARRLWIARSSDDGKTFAEEAPALKEPTGACPCCSTEVFADSKGRVYAMYRIAASRAERDMALVTSTDQGRTFRSARIDPWPVPT